ncbi:dihydrolipoyl dehydrogenase [Oryzomonas sagensis]|uniref:Dihydrolipoyl dehydrogenase n=1 Tax=Oryzomonas sagensis TaxID=2603857 RepID=A0ABQ6TJX3_9BACT|nr:dihydrolipoyl dehydrogenase [Oryzomonas sagensis]KAB0668197.1 dihydrolipoyl dehydrogenase [Oryzomonas sagensis]
MSDHIFDLIVIGAGPGGYVAAIRATQLGMKVAVVEKRDALGGVCLNEGCIPSKALLDSSEFFAVARDRFPVHGIDIAPPQLNLEAMMRRKDDVVKKNTDGIAYLFKKNEIEWVRGTGRLVGRNALGRHEVEVALAEATGPAGQQSLPPDAATSVKLQAQRVLLATGSEAATLPGIPFDGQVVVSAREALCFDELPQHLVVAGGSFIGLELGSVWRRLGAQVTVIEMMPQIVPIMDRQAGDTLYRSLRKQGIEFKLGTRISGVRRIGSKAIVQYNAGTGSEEIDCDRLLVAVGRRPLTAGLNLEEVGVRLDEKGRVAVDGDYQTSVPGIYAIGDLVPGPMLAHKASEEGVACVERMAGKVAAVEYEYIPGVVYTWPEGATVGQTEEQLKEAGIPYRSGRFNFAALGRARCMDETEGFVKILAHQDTDRVLGVHIVGPRASDLIAEAVAIMSFGGTARDIALICHAHPTLPEAVREAALDVHKEAIHA